MDRIESAASRLSATRIVHNLKYMPEDDFKEHKKWPVIDQKRQHFPVACFVEELLLRLFGLGDLLNFIDGWPPRRRTRSATFPPRDQPNMPVRR